MQKKATTMTYSSSSRTTKAMCSTSRDVILNLLAMFNFSLVMVFNTFCPYGVSRKTFYLMCFLNLDSGSRRNSFLVDSCLDCFTSPSFRFYMNFLITYNVLKVMVVHMLVDHAVSSSLYLGCFFRWFLMFIFC